ncbi:hypothetical protein NDU88_011274 [Pleurodeles waltl]|uniref:Uncharacterized protein n=1 Tax=Pleurodeles waltl TaxID=8319 RepID=A0AAV7QZK7_PLEWA|nr:hypothetical protein NDU88_011274 [Pleurodeles waltl]
MRVGNATVMFFPDYTVAVQKQHNNFLAVKRHRRELGLTYSLLFLARLRVVADGAAYFFSTPRRHGTGWRALMSVRHVQIDWRQRRKIITSGVVEGIVR